MDRRWQVIQHDRRNKMNEHDTKELENIIRLAIQKCFDSMTDEQVFNAVYDYNRFIKQELEA